MTQPPVESRSSIIDAVKTPLGFLVLGLSVVEVTVSALAVSLVEFRAVLVWTVVLSIPAFVLIVVGLAVWQPEALRGDRPLQDVYASQFATDLYLGLVGAMGNLRPLEREEAWLTVADVITSDSKADASYSRFCAGVAARLKKLANLSNRAIATRGPIAP